MPRIPIRDIEKFVEQDKWEELSDEAFLKIEEEETKKKKDLKEKKNLSY